MFTFKGIAQKYHFPKNNQIQKRITMFMMCVYTCPAENLPLRKLKAQRLIQKIGGLFYLSRAESIAAKL